MLKQLLSKTNLNWLRSPFEKKVNKREPMTHILINGIPKSGTLFLSRVVSETIGCETMRIATRGILDSQADAEAIVHFFNQPACVAQQHIAPTDYNLEILRVTGLNKFIIVIRDPRDVLVSFKHHLHRDDVVGNKWHLAIMVASGVISENFYNLTNHDKFENLIDNAFVKFQQWIYEWIRHLDNPDFNIKLIRYEDFSSNNIITVSEIFDFLNIDIPLEKWSIPEINKKKEGIDMETHFRRGAPGTYKDELSNDQIDRINSMIDKNLYLKMNWELP